MPETLSGNTSTNTSLLTDIFSEDSDMELPDISTLVKCKRSITQRKERKKSKCLRTVRSTSSRKKEVKWEDIPDGVQARACQFNPQNPPGVGSSAIGVVDPLSCLPLYLLPIYNYIL